MSGGQRVLVIVPTYDERENLPRVVPMILEQGEAFHILVVDDNSPDGTGDLADDLAARSDRVHVLHRPRKEGLGAAYVAGFGWGLDGDFDVLVEMDADLSHPPTGCRRWSRPSRRWTWRSAPATSEAGSPW